MTLRKAFKRLSDDDRGATLIEFAIVAPVMLVLIMGVMDLSYQAYLQSILDGEIQRAGRNSAIQGGADNVAAIDGRIRTAIRQIAPSATVSSQRLFNSRFAQFRPEPFRDTNGNSQRDPTECYDDVNGNRAYDLSPGRGGQGGANDVTRLTVTVTYRTPFPTLGLIGWSPVNTLTSRTLLRNQPFARQTENVVTEVCT